MTTVCGMSVYIKAFVGMEHVKNLNGYKQKCGRSHNNLQILGDTPALVAEFQAF